MSLYDPLSWVRRCLLLLVAGNHLHPLTSPQIADCIRHHLTIAGGPTPCRRRRHQRDRPRTCGLPRQIGNLAVAALIARYARRNTIIDMDCATAAIVDQPTPDPHSVIPHGPASDTTPDGANVIQQVAPQPAAARCLCALDSHSWLSFSL
jgi:hypothetical protein